VIPKSGYRFSEKIMLHPKIRNEMTIRRKVISFYRNTAASRASCVMRGQSPDAMASFGATHDPPTASTFGQAK
jgi:hypothetical protein